MTFFGNIVYCALVVSFAALAPREGRELFIIINKQGQAISMCFCQRNLFVLPESNEN